MKRPGFFSSFSRKMPSLVIFALAWRSAEQETPMPTGQEAPWRGRRMTRTSSAKYLPPNCAPMPISRAACEQFRLEFEVAERPAVLVAGGRAGRRRYLVEASLTVLRQVSAEVPPMTKAR